MTTKYVLARTLQAGVLLLLAAGSGVAAAQSEPDRKQSQPSDALTEVVVTARKRDERLIDVPIAVVALDAAALESRGIRSLADLAAATPGLTLDSTIGGSVRSDRSFNIYVIRGMVPSLTSNPTTSVFVNGAAFSSGQIGGLDDLARVEVLQGPQSAYFGRQTFAGAINFITREPSETFGGSLSALGGTRNYVDVRGSLEGPVVSDTLTARASVRYFSRDGSYDNQAVAQKSHKTLGDQSTTNETLQVRWKPTENFKVNGLFMYWEDKDGPGATAQFEHTSQNCRTAGGYSWFCGSVGSITAGHPASNDIVDAPILAIVNKANAAIAASGVPGFTIPSKFGLERKAYHWSVGIDYKIEPLGLTVSSLTAAADDKYGTLIDLDNTDTSQVARPVFYPATSQTFYNFPFWVGQHNQDQSQELRVVSDAARRFRWLIGGNYAYNKRVQAIGGTEFNLVFGAPALNISNSAGVFFGLAYDLNDNWTVNFDGRRQREEQSVPGVVKAAFYNFTPRFTVQYKISPDVMTYLTYSEGINPGAFNSTVLNDFEKAYIAANLANVFNSSVIVSPEKLKNIELGLKGKFLDNKVTLTAAIYSDKWSNQITVSTFNVPLDASQTIPNLILNNSNNGESRIQGFEFNVDWAPIRNLVLSFAGAINESKIQRGTFGSPGQIACGCSTPTAAQQSFNGNQLPNTAKTQFSAAVLYTGTWASRPDWHWFARLDDNYKSKQFESQDNLASSPALNFLNARAGVTSGGWRVEAFVENLNNERGVTNIATVTSLATPFSPPLKDALFAGLPNLRTYGLRVGYKFGGAK